ncbi:MAG: DHA2 family efflux MFS transporter permease subunit [Methylobacteriaceae bacterium]|nr:DHA2 family efflux MFS transporter permease subunit [Methylobacteriaceae bacterium]
MSHALHASCDAATARSTPADSRPHHANLILATSILASSLAFIDGSVVNVALPTIGRAFAAGADALQWVVNAYLLPLSALLLLGGGAGDRFGRRRMLIAGTAVFALASLACAFAPNLPVLLAGRLAQGVSAALLMPNSLAVLGATFTGEAKGRAIGIWAAVGAMGGAVGPVLGGWLVDLGSWRAIFLINVPIAGAAVLLAWRFVPVDADGGDRPLDAAGGILASLALGALTWGLTIGSGPLGWTPAAIGLLVAGIGLGAAFGIVERRRADRAMMPLALFASRRFVGLTLLTFFLYGALGGLIVLLPYMLIEGAGYSGTAAGAALLPLPLVIALSSPLMGALAGRIGARLPLSIGPLVVGLGFLLALRMEAGGDYWWTVLPAILVVALGMSGAVAPLTTAVLSSVDQEHAGSASGLNSAVARTGGLVATALLGSVLAAHGADLVSAFHAAAVVGAGACAAASLSAFALVRDDERTARGAPQGA